MQAPQHHIACRCPPRCSFGGASTSCPTFSSPPGSQGTSRSPGVVLFNVINTPLHRLSRGIVRVRPLVATPHACACPFAAASRPRTRPLVVAHLVCPYTCLLGAARLLCSCACPLGTAPHVCAQSPWVPTPRALWQRLFQPCLLARCWKFPWPGLVQCPQPALFDYAHAAALPLGRVCQRPGVDFPRICVHVHSHAPPHLCVSMLEGSTSLASG